MATIDEAVAPPTEAPVITTGVTPPPAGQESGVANVNLDYDPNFKTVVRSVVDPTPKNQIAAADVLSSREKNAPNEHPNEQMQMGKMVISLLQGKIGEAYKWYNGGGVKYEKGRDVFGNEYWVPKNERGFTDNYLGSDRKPLTAEQKKDLIAKGGLLTETDANALRTANWQNAETASKEAANGFNSQLRAAQTAAYAASNEANATNNNIDREIGLAFKLKNALGTVSQLSPQDRQKLFSFVQRYNTNSEALRKSQEKSGGVGATSGAQAGAGVGGAEGTAATGGKAGLNANVSAQSGQSARLGETNVDARNRENTLQDQQNLEAAIRGLMQGSLKSPEEFNDFMRLHTLNQMNNEAAAKIPDNVKPAGYQNPPAVDIYTTGLDGLLESRYAQQANNALIAAWNADLYKAQKDQITSGKTYTQQELQEKFKNSDVVKGIVNRAIYKTDKVLGRESRLKKGDMVMDTNGKLVPIE